MSVEFTDVTPQNVKTAIDLAVELSGKGDVYRPQIELEFGASVGDAEKQEIVRRELGISSAGFFLVYKDGQAAGMAGHYRIAGHENDAWLGWMAVDPAFRGQGLGKLLVREAFNRAAAAAPVTVQRIYTTPEPVFEPARALYSGLGFTQESYKPEADDAARLIAVFSRRADPATGPVVVGDPDSWQQSGYPIDCDKYEIPDLNEEMGLPVRPQPPSVPGPELRPF